MDGEKNESDEDAKVGVVASDTVGVTTRKFFSQTHLRSAVLNAQQAGKYEKEWGNIDEFNEEIAREKLEHQAHVISSLISSALYIETTIQEFLADISHEMAINSKYDFEDDFVNQFRQIDAELGRSIKFSATPIQRYQFMLILADVDTFDTGQKPCQDAADLLNLRNYLVHYEPEDVKISSTEGEVKIDNKLVNKLRNKNISKNPLENGASIVQYISHDCAEWGVEAALKFTDEFFSRLEQRPPYDHVRSEIVGDISRL